MTNPYESPAPIEPGSEFHEHFDGRPPSKLVGHIRVVAVLTIVQGVLILLMGLLFAGFAAIMPIAMGQMGGQEGMPENPLASQGEFLFWMSVVYGIMGAVVTCIGGLHIWAGIQNYRYRQRVLGIVAISAGLVAALTVYCAPTAIGLAIYGLIVYLNEDVTAEFRARGKKRGGGKAVDVGNVGHG